MSNQLQAAADMQQQITEWQQQNPALVVRGIDESTWNALCTSVFPGANPDSVLLAVDYCRARQLDIMLKPVHIVPMSIKQPNGQYRMQDTILPGIGLYRIQAARAGDMAGMDPPEFGPMVTYDLAGQKYTVPEWCKVTIHKLMGDRIVSYPHVEYWLEVYATAGKDTDAPNKMWKKRSRGQLAKCAEAGALRKAWPEVGQEATADEMEGRSYETAVRDVSQQQPAITQASDLNSILAQQAAKQIGNGQQAQRDPVHPDNGQQAQRDPVHPDVMPVIENKDPTVVADLAIKTMESASDSATLHQFHTEALDRMRALYKHWNGNDEKQGLCQSLVMNINATFDELNVKFMQEVGA